MATVSYTDLWLLGDINAKACPERLLPLFKGEIERGWLLPVGTFGLVKNKLLKNSSLKNNR